MKKLMKVVLPLAVATLCLSACSGGSEDETTAGKITAAQTESTNEATSEEASVKETSEKTEETTPEETTSEEAPEETTTPANELGDSLQDKAKVSYNGVTFGTGDKASEITALLGDQPAPPAEVVSCIAAEMVTEYYYYGMSFQVKDDIIFSIDITDNGYTGNATPCTVAGLGIGAGSDEIPTLYGEGTALDENNLYYSEGSLSFQVLSTNGVVADIWITDSAVAN